MRAMRVGKGEKQRQEMEVIIRWSCLRGREKERERKVYCLIIRDVREV